MSASGVLPSAFILRSAKIVAYLLNLEHPRGQTKAKFFLGFGFRRDDPQAFADALIDHAIPAHFARESIDGFGHRVLEFEGQIVAPDGRRPRIKTVWIFVAPDSASFVTAHPMPRKGLASD